MFEYAHPLTGTFRAETFASELLLDDSRIGSV